MHRSLRTPISITAAFAAAALALPALAQAAPTFVRGEQVDRGDGPGGTTGWVAYTPGVQVFDYPQGGPFAVTDDGRYAFLTYPTSSTKRGLYRRDLVANTSRLVLDDVVPTGATTSRAKLSVITKRSLAAADTNAGNDLYLVDPFTGAATLASTTPAGAALGDLTTGAITADGSAVVYSRPGGTYRRVLTSTTPTLLSARALPSSAANLSDQALSADGHAALLSGDWAVTTAATGDRSLAETSSGPGPISISADGTTAARIVAETTSATPKIVVRVYNLAAGTKRTVTPGLPANAGGFDIVRLSADGRTAVATASFAGTSTTSTPAPATYVLGTVDLTTGAVATTSGSFASPAPRLLSPNGRYGITADAAHTWVVPTAAGATLPGGTDGAAALVFITYGAGCKPPASAAWWYDGRPSVMLNQSAYYASGFAVPPTSVAVRASVASTGAVMNAFTLVPGDDSRKLNAYYGAINLDVTAKFPDGSTSTGRGPVSAYTAPTCPPIYL